MPLTRYKQVDEPHKRQKRPGPPGAVEHVATQYQIGKGYTCAECSTYHGYTTERQCWVCGAPIVNPPRRPAGFGTLAGDRAGNQ